jgi:uncharacterized protein (TIGR03067 family)
MSFHRFAVLALAMLMEPNKGLGDDAKKDLQKLQGEWNLVSAAIKGKDVTDRAKREFRMTIKGKKFVLHIGGNKLAYTFRVNSTTSPKEIDFDPDHVRPVLGIFAFEDNKLKISWVARGMERPKGFAYNGESEQVTLIVKPKKR